MVCPEVLRRSQLALRVPEDADGNPMPKAKARPKLRPGAKCKSKASAKAKAKGKGKEEPDNMQADEASDIPKPETAASDVAMELADEVAEASEVKDPPAPARKRRKTKSEMDQTKESKGEKNKETIQVSERPQEEPTGGALNGEEPAADARKGKKRQRGVEASCFARRSLPATEAGKLKWQALKEAFGSIVKPHLIHYSAEEEVWR